MKFEHEEKRTPTFRAWAASPAFQPDSKWEIVRVFVNDEWRTVTFVTDEFRINIKYDSGKKLEQTATGLAKILTKHCRANVKVLSTERAEIDVNPASDADETPQLFEKDDLGFSPKAKS